MTNRLSGATSPYLLQHADNPVDWWEWGPEAFAEARRRDVPILLSVGYAACHWCHVMAHESFEDEGVAATLNAGFVSIKVDREERPDVDAAYMTATTAMTGRGGWPMTCLLTPDLEPFFAGTYFPRAQFLSLLAQAGQAWTNRRDDVLASGANVTQQLQAHTQPVRAVAVEAAALDRAARALLGQFDSARGGFGGAPKFPPSMVLAFLLRHAARTGSEQSSAMVAATCVAMARGGLYDQLGGGFARYSVDADWVVPHFEKMLYDNGLLVRVYAEWARQGGGEFARRVTAETADFLLADLRTPEGMFAAALDADTEGIEGLTYVWTPAELTAALGAADGAAAADVFTVTAHGTFELGTSTLQYRCDAADSDWYAGIRERLRTIRAARPQPSRDDKVVASWNGLAIAALSIAGRVLGRPDYVAAAEVCAEQLIARQVVDGRLVRVSRGARLSTAPGQADDYGNLIEGLCQLYQADGRTEWPSAATGLADTAGDLFRRADGWAEQPKDGEALYLTPPAGADNAEPSGLSALAMGLLTLSALTERADLRAAAEALITQNGALAVDNPRFGGWTLAAAEAVVAGPLQVAVVGSGPVAREMIDTVAGSPSPGLVLAYGAEADEAVPLLAGRVAVGGEATAYVCRQFVCDAPVTAVADLERGLRESGAAGNGWDRT